MLEERLCFSPELHGGCSPTPWAPCACRERQCLAKAATKVGIRRRGHCGLAISRGALGRIDLLTSLQVLKVHNQSDLSVLPHGLAKLTQLQELHISPSALQDLSPANRKLMNSVPIFELR